MERVGWGREMEQEKQHIRERASGEEGTMRSGTMRSARVGISEGEQQTRDSKKICTLMGC